MKVRIIKTGEVKSAAAGYALRLIEQGKAVPVKEAARPAPRKEAEPKPKPKVEDKASPKAKE